MTETFEHTPSVPARFHEYANLFPLIQGEALSALREDIRVYGVREPIVFLDGAILDGRNRYMCSRDLLIEYPRVEYDGDDPMGFVISHNLHRRHLSESQRALVAAKLSNMSVGQPEKNTANLQNTSRATAAELLNVSERTVNTAKKVERDGSQELIDAVQQGGVAVSAAAEVLQLPNDEQLEVASLPAKERKAFVSNNSGNNEWYTPESIIEAARGVLGGFDLDPASSVIANQTVKAEYFLTEEDNGLAGNWPVCRIWMNPPYAQPLMGQFATKYAEAIRAGSTGIVLVNNATETAWFREIISVSTAVCFHQSRIRFVDQTGVQSGAPLQGQAIIYAGNNPLKFVEVFRAFGTVMAEFPLAEAA